MFPDSPMEKGLLTNILVNSTMESSTLLCAVCEVVSTMFTDMSKTDLASLWLTIPNSRHLRCVIVETLFGRADGQGLELRLEGSTEQHSAHLSNVGSVHENVSLHCYCGRWRLSCCVWGWELVDESWEKWEMGGVCMCVWVHVTREGEGFSPLVVHNST